MDLPGFGKSPLPGNGNDLQSYIRPIACLLDSLHCQTVVGHSLGGLAALALAEQMESKRLNIVLVSASLRRATNLATQGLAAAKDDPGLAIAMSAQIVGGLNPFGQAAARILPKSSLVRRLTLWPYLKHPAGHFDESMYAAIADSGSSQTIAILKLAETLNIDAAVSAPASLAQIVGDGDRLISQEDIEFFEAHGAKTTILTDCGHWPMFEKPAQLRTALLGHLSEIVDE